MKKLIKKILNNNIGSVLVMVVAVMLSLVAVASSASLMVVTGYNQLQTQYSHDKIQEELLLRSESTRLHLAIEHDNARALPNRIVEIMGPDRRTTYKIYSRGELVVISSFMGLATEQAYAIQSLITAKRERWLVPSYKSPIKRYSERLVKNRSLAEYQYFTNTESSENADGGPEAAAVKFYGADNLYGPVHSNDFIWIQNSGGWPTFHDMVTTSKWIMDYGTGARAILTAPMTQIFLGGYAEEVPEIIFSPTADLIKQNGMTLGGEDIDIVYVVLANGSFESMYGTIVETGIDTFGVYSWFPHTDDLANYVVTNGGNWYEDSNHLWTNYITMYDTIWANGGTFPVTNQSVWVGDSELWIEGSVYGAQTWASADTVFIVGDITYANTNVGSPPDATGNINLTDYFGLVSEKKILIRYKHKDPFDDMALREDNCNDGHVFLYGAYAAIGEGLESVHGAMACHYDGIFTFQYHHPHGSTPDYMAMSPYVSEEFTLRLIDTGGDGWDGAEIDVLINGEIILDGISCYGGLSTHVFNVYTLDIIETVYTAGTNEDEHLYEILDHEGVVVASDGPNPGPGIIFQAQFTPEERDTLYSHIDLHKFIFPPNGAYPPEIQGFELHGAAPAPPYGTCGFPLVSNAYVNSYPNNNSNNYAYPRGTDYPWYNPVWPESAADLYFERGILHIYGAIAQRRRGFIHRSGGDDYNHPQGMSSPSPWEMEEYHFDGDHPPTGYNKDYHYDKRLLFVQPPDFPQIYEGWGETTLTAFEKKSWFYKTPPKNFNEFTQ